MPHVSRLSNRKRLKQIINLAPAISKRVKANAHLVEQGQVEIGQGRRRRISDVPPAPHLAGRASGDQDRQVHMVVHVRVAHPAAVEIEAVVQKRAVPFGRRLELGEEFGEERHVEPVDLGHLGDFGGVVPVVGERVVRVGYADLRIGSRTGFAGELERDDAGDVAVERQHL